ncbi:MAG: leucyl aminopeptidase [Chloroflexia bacterium]|nr:leucyl aminopeptidase [Chloroflexia bacterium]
MQVTVQSGGLEAVSTEVLAVPLFEEGVEAVPVTAEIDRRLNGQLALAVAAGHVSPKLNGISSLLTLGLLPFTRVILIGAGKQDDWDAQRARTFAGIAVRQARTTGQPSLTVALPAGADNAASVAGAVHGAALANFSTAQFKSTEPEDVDVEGLNLLLTDDTDKVRTAAEKARILGEAANLARSLANEPGNVLTPTTFAERARAVAEAHSLEYDVLDESQMQDLGYGGLLGTSRGSAEPAKLVTLRYTGGTGEATIGLVGKGITFDSGGISIKPAAQMHRMKGDMSGAAAVLGTMRAIGELRPKVNVVGVLCLSENLPGPTAMKPGDILTAGNGKTIEILNTDAEGRLVLADGLVHALSQGATHLVDVATLTGACVVALGSVTTGVFGSHQPWTDVVLNAARHTGEPMWQMPLGAEYRRQMDSDIADIANAGNREAGAITAATFLQEFAGGVPWVHLDIAGTARNEKDLPHIAKGPTGVAVATLTQVVENVGRDGAPS